MTLTRMLSYIPMSHLRRGMKQFFIWVEYFVLKQCKAYCSFPKKMSLLFRTGKSGVTSEKQ